MPPHCWGSMLSLHLGALGPFPVSAQPSRLRTRHRLTISTAVKPSPCVADRPSFRLLPASWAKASGCDGNLRFVGGGGGCGRDINDGAGGGDIGDGGGDNNDGGGDEDDMPIEAFRVLGGIARLRRLLQRGALKEHHLADDFFTTMNCCSSIFTEDNVECQSSSSMHAINPVGAGASSCDGKNDEEHTLDPIVLNSTMNSRSKYSDKNSRKETMRMRETKSNSPSLSVDIGIPGDENGSDENEMKIKGRRGFVFTIAASSFAWSMGLIPYWSFCCSNTPLSIFGTWMDILTTAHIVVAIGSLILTGLASHFKEGELPDNKGFKLLQIVLFFVDLWLCAASFLPLHVCKGISNLVVWSFASAAFCVIALSWIAILLPTEMVIKCIKTMFQKVALWLINMRLPGYITTKLKKVRGTQRGPSQPMEKV